jgi:protein required for attachment to host cells
MPDPVIANVCVTMDHFNQRLYVNDCDDIDSIVPTEDSIRDAHGEENVDSRYFDEYNPGSSVEEKDAFIADKVAEGYTVV